MSEYGYGDYVVYDPGYRPAEVGRVVRRGRGGWFVCYHAGCTAALTPDETLRPATAEEVARVVSGAPAQGSLLSGVGTSAASHGRWSCSKTNTHERKANDG